MIRLNLAKEPYWLDLGHKVRVQVMPATTALFSAASSSAALRSLPPETDQDARFVVLCAEVAKLAILSWEGLCGDEGEPVDVSPEAVQSMMDIYQLGTAFAREYVTRGLLVSAEKNV